MMGLEPTICSLGESRVIRFATSDHLYKSPTNFILYGEGYAFL
jgi:hypothetical protein